ncbi:MAG: transposase [Candidatus Thiodiazotropha sp.]
MNGANRRRLEEEAGKLEDVSFLAQGNPVRGMAERLGVTVHSLYAWQKKLGPQQAKDQELDEAQCELRRLKAELRRVTEERDIMKKAATYFAKEFGLSLALFGAIAMNFGWQRCAGCSMSIRVASMHGSRTR